MSAAWAERPPERLEARIAIGADGRVVARSGKVEFGQGIRTGFRRIVAHELYLPPEAVEVVLGETESAPWDGGTFGSTSTAVDGARLRAAAAYAFALLRERAAAALGVRADALEARDGALWAPDGRSARYGELAAGAPLAGPVPPDGALAFAPGPDAPWGARRIEAEALVRGAARFPHDVRLPRMVRGHAVAPPWPGARLAALDTRAIDGMPGVVAVVRDGDFVGVLAERREQAERATAAIRAEWQALPGADAAPVEVAVRRDRGVDDALAAGARLLSARYRLPHIAHASILPSAAVADVRPDGADLYVATQRPFPLRDSVARLLGLAPERVRVHPQQMSGMYGGGGWDRAAVDAVRLSRAAGRPVLVEWTRADEFQRAAVRPSLDALLEAALSERGRVGAWRARLRTQSFVAGGGAARPEAAAATAGRASVPPYELGPSEVVLQIEPDGVDTGALRSLGAAPNVFAIESFMDELALAATRDPLAFRLEHVSDARLTAVLEAVAALADWPRRPQAEGRAFGLAAAIYHGTYVAEVVEVVVTGGGKVRVPRVFAAVDAGRLVDPAGARSQIEGGIVQALSWALFEECRVEGGRVTAHGWRDYPIATARDAPEAVAVRFLDRADRPSSGVGEPGAVPVAAALANAVAAATGVRVRDLPLTPARLYDGLLAR